MTAETPQGHDHSTREAALEAVAASAADNIPGADLVSITVRGPEGSLRTEAATDPLAEQADRWQYQLREGPCYTAVIKDRFVLVSDLSTSTEFPRYAPKAVDLGIGAQAAIRLLNDGEIAGLNLYARSAGAFDRSTIEFAESFATQAGALLGYAEQVDQLTEALRSRTDIGTSIGILMERYGLDRHQAFAFLTRNSQTRNVKVRVLAQQVIDGSFDASPGSRPHQ